MSDLTPPEESLQEGLARLGRETATAVPHAAEPARDTSAPVTAVPSTATWVTEQPHHTVLRRAMWLGLVAGLAAVVAGFVWASTLGAAPDWSSWSDRGAALLIGGGGVVAVGCGIGLVLHGRTVRVPVNRLVAFLVGCAALFLLMTATAVVVELLTSLISGRDFSWESVGDLLDTW